MIGIFHLCLLRKENVGAESDCQPDFEVKRKKAEKPSKRVLYMRSQCHASHAQAANRKREKRQRAQKKNRQCKNVVVVACVLK